MSKTRGSRNGDTVTSRVSGEKLCAVMSRGAVATFKCDKFNEETDDWEIYIQRFEIELIRQEIPKDEKSAPYHPKTNGLAERAVRTFKDRIKASDSKNLDIRVQQFLISYRNTPHSSTGRAPTELFWGRRLHIKLDLLKPSVKTNMERAIFKQEINHDRHARERLFREGEKVCAWSVRKNKYEEATIVRRTGRWSYRVLIDGEEKKMHADHLRKGVGKKML